MSAHLEGAEVVNGRILRQIEPSLCVLRADGDVDDDLGLVVDDLEALFDSGDKIDIVDGASVHKDHVFEVLGWEDSWDGA